MNRCLRVYATGTYPILYVLNRVCKWPELRLKSSRSFLLLHKLNQGFAWCTNTYSVYKLTFFNCTDSSTHLCTPQAQSEKLDRALAKKGVNDKDLIAELPDTCARLKEMGEVIEKGVRCISFGYYCSQRFVTLRARMTVVVMALASTAILSCAWL
jgi:hypothetical protein